MTDIQIAKDILEKENNAIVVVKDKKVIYKSKDKGIKPMYILVKEMKDISQESSVADRVIGKGAALLCKYLNVSKVYGNLMSESAIEVLEKENISYNFNTLCKYIKNRDYTDYCPIEKIAMKIDNEKLFLKELDKFFNK